MSTEDRLTAVEDSLQDVIEAVRIMNEGQKRVEESVQLLAESFQRLVEHQAETDEAVNRMLRHLRMRSDDGNQQ